MDFTVVYYAFTLTVVFTFRVRRSRDEMYSGHGLLFVWLSLTAFAHYCTDPGVTWRNSMGCPLVAHYWADLQSVHGFRCYDSITPNAKCQRVLVLALCLVLFIFHIFHFSHAVYRVGYLSCVRVITVSVITVLTVIRQTVMNTQTCHSVIQFADNES